MFRGFFHGRPSLAQPGGQSEATDMDWARSYGRAGREDTRSPGRFLPYRCNAGWVGRGMGSRTEAVINSSVFDATL